MDIESLFQDARNALMEADFHCSGHGDTPLIDRLQTLDVRLCPLLSLADAVEAPAMRAAVEALCALFKQHPSTKAPESLLAPLFKDLLDSLRYGVTACRQIIKKECISDPDPLVHFGQAFAMGFRQMEALLLHPDQPPPARGLRILIADDEEMIREILHHHLTTQGHLVLSVTNGADGIASLSTNHFDVMLTDINMPHASGIDVLKAAQELKVDAEVIIITGYASMQSAAEAVRFGAYDYIVKPFDDPEILFSAIRRAADQVQLKRQNRRLIVDLQRKNRQMERYARHLERTLETIREKDRALLHADRMATLGVLAAGVAHEINNPTTFIRGNVQTLQKFWDAIARMLEASLEENPMKSFILQEVPSLLQDMFTGTERIAKITRGLCSYAGREIEPVREAYRIGECVNEALRMTGNALADKVEIECILAETPELVGDAQQIVQVFVNLILNAADALENRPDARIQILTVPTGDGVEIAVEDNGPGIPADIRDRIFDPFFTTKTVGRGTGLGLSVVLGIVHAHGGQIHVWSESGKGAQFSIFLPLRTGTGEETRPVVLFAAPETGMTRTMVQGIRFHGAYAVEWIRQADEVWARCTREDPPGVLVLDMQLHGLGVFDLLRRIQTSPKTAGLPILVLTEDAVPGMMERIQRGGAARILQTPVRLEDLIATITEMLHREPPTVTFDAVPASPATPETETAHEG